MSSKKICSNCADIFIINPYFGTNTECKDCHITIVSESLHKRGIKYHLKPTFIKKISRRKFFSCEVIEEE
jgi:uncharacterized protein (UPF0179 family)